MKARNILNSAKAWMLAHPDACFVALGLLAAFVLGVWVG